MDSCCPVCSLPVTRCRGCPRFGLLLSHVFSSVPCLASCCSVRCLWFPCLVLSRFCLMLSNVSHLAVPCLVTCCSVLSLAVLYPIFCSSMYCFVKFHALSLVVPGCVSCCLMSCRSLSQVLLLAAPCTVWVAFHFM